MKSVETTGFSILRAVIYPILLFHCNDLVKLHKNERSHWRESWCMVGYHNKPLSYIILQQVPDRKSSELLSYSKVGITENRQSLCRMLFRDRSTGSQWYSVWDAVCPVRTKVIATGGRASAYGSVCTGASNARSRKQWTGCRVKAPAQLFHSRNWSSLSCLFLLSSLPTAHPGQFTGVFEYGDIANRTYRKHAL